ncbi:MAG: phosphatase PAP2 family protein [Methylosarcina sp.]
MAVPELMTALFMWFAMAVLLILIDRRSAPPFTWDIAILTRVSACRSRWLDRFFSAVTVFGSFFVLTPITAFILWMLIHTGRLEEGCFLALSFIGASVIANLTKPVFKRKRPDLFPPLGKMPLHSSYPSAHSAQIMAFVTSLFLIFDPAGSQFAVWLIAAAFLMAAMVAFSRIYLQVHYPSDVVAGLMLALLWVMGTEHLLVLFGISIK